MSPTVHCVRHAQGFHNLCAANHSIRDPTLTPVGEEQCRQLAEDFPFHDQIDLIVASPLKRTIYTALISFGDIIARKNLKVIALPELQETSDLPCDTGNTPEDLAKEFEGKPVDLSFVKPGWESKRMQWAPFPKAIESRARSARQWLMARPEQNIVVVTHGGFLHYFTEDWTDSSRFSGTGWANTEFRSFTFSGKDTESAHVIETPESRKRRVGEPDRLLDREEQENLKLSATKEWTEKGYVHQELRAQDTFKNAQRLQAKIAEQRRDDIGDAY